MATIQSLGIGSGLLTSELLENLVNAERAPAELRLDSQKALVDAKISAFGEVSSAISQLNSSMKALNSVSAFNASTATSSNQDALTATATTIAGNGTYSVNIQQLAQQHTIATQSYSSINEAIGTGVLTFRFGTTDIDEFDVYQGFAVNTDKPSRNVIISSSNNTLAGMRDAINDADIGVQATIVDDGSGFRLLLTSDEAGADNSIQLTGSGTAGMTAFNFNEISQAATQTQAAQDAQFTVNGLSVTRENNLVVGVIPGVTLNLKETTNGPVSLSVSKDPAALLEKMQGFVDSYNQLKTLGDTLTAFNAEAGESGQGSLLTGDAALRRMMSEINSTLRSFNTTLDVRSLAEVGISTDQFSDYQLKLDSAKFRTAFTADPSAVTSLFAANGVSSDNEVEFIRAGSQTKAGQFAVEITRMATTGSYEGVSVSALGAGNIAIDSSNKTLTVRLNSSEASITLTEGTYATADDLAEEIQRQINSNSEVLDAEDTITVSFNATDNRFEMSSNRYGSESVVRIVSISTAAANTLGLVEDGYGPFLGNQLASLANTTGVSSDPFDTALVVDSDTEFEFSVNGISSGLLSLPQTTYTTPDELTTALKSMLDTAFSGDGIEVFVDYVYNADDDYGRLVFSTADAGDLFTFSQVNVASAQKLGLHEGAGAAAVATRGVDVAGTINGIEATGKGQILSASSSKDPAVPGFYLNAAYGDLSASSVLDSFKVEVDGILSGNITLGVLADTDPDAVATVMQTAINNDAALMAAGVSVRVEYDASSGGFGIISNTVGPSSSVSVSALQGDASSIFGFATGKGSLGAIGKSASGEADASAGLILKISGGSTGSRGTINYSRGVADQLNRLLDAYLKPGGILGGRQAALNQELVKIADDRVSLNERLARTESKLAASFTANDIIINKFNTTADFLTSQLSMLEAIAKPKSKN
ncbi:MAG: flagellar filament capping protein FliD [Pseudohongiella sp.]|nr:flagellar filament capping protein FliD [Pseudohongiella sp.]